ncbi:acyl carrier protein [Kitasatospora sp. NPDC004240]
MTEDDIKQFVADTFGFETPAGEIDPEEPLWGPESRFGLDSIDSLKLIAALRERQAFDIGGLAPGTFRSVRSIAGFLNPVTANPA